MPETDIIGHFISVLLSRATVVLGSLNMSRDDWWVEFRPKWPDVVRLRYLTPYRDNRKWVEWRIPVNSVFVLEHEDQTETYVDYHLHRFKEEILRTVVGVHENSPPDTVC